MSEIRSGTDVGKMIVCFLDESGSRDIFTMACGLSTDTKWLRFDKEWKRALAEFRVPYFHMRELAPRPKGPYVGWTHEDADALIEKLIWVFKNYVIGWCGVTVSVKDFYQYIPADRRKWLRNPYFHAFNSLISAVLLYCQEFRLEGKISFMLDGGTVSPTHTTGYFEAFKSLKHAPNSDQLGVLLIGNDKKNHALQAADLLAYEIHKHAHGFERKSYASLRELTHGVLHWDGESLKEVASKMKQPSVHSE